ncbi:MAG: hypothetical protein HPY87_08905 [Fervidobacterium sp.]|uniref:tape measure protein n=1 Tax=Fervidobacterium sp. TaxID=1871331 RepID=UPI0025BBD8F1|nr:tape measure protein [Fervidobacterium sp.]NPU89979.1 hypothetical protein [Fervidobacterium sp.]
MGNFERGGIELIVQGAMTFARDIGHVSASLIQLGKAYYTLQRQTQGAMAAQISEQNAILKRISILNNEISAMQRTITQYQKLQTIRMLEAKAADIQPALQSANLALQKQAIIVSELESKIANLKSQQTQFVIKEIEVTNALRNTESGIARLKSMYDVARGSSNMFTSETARLASEIQKLQREQKAYKDELSQLAVAQDMVIKEINDTNNALSSAKEKYQQAESNVNKLQIAYDRLKGKASIVSDKIAEYSKKIDENKEKISQLGEQYISAGGSVDDLAGDISDLGIKIQKNSTLISTLKGGWQQISAIFSRVQIAIGVVTVAFNVLGTAINIIGSIVRTAIRIFSDFVNTIFNVTKALLSIPFNIIKSGFESVGRIIQNAFAFLLGMNLDRIIWDFGQKFREVGKLVLDSAADFQLMQIRLEGLGAVEYLNAGKVSTFNDGIARARDEVKGLIDKFVEVAIKSPFSIESVTNTFTLARAYGYTTEKASSLTNSIVAFASGMGLGNDEMKRIIENFGQMRAAGKLTGTELRDLARGAFIPINDVFRVMVERAENAAKKLEELKKRGEEIPDGLEELASLAGKSAEEIHELGKTGKISTDLFTDAFENLVSKRFPNILDRMKKSFEVARSNVKDLFQGLVGMRVIKPVLDEVGGFINEFIEKGFSEESRKKADLLGQSLASATQSGIMFFNLLRDKLFKLDFGKWFSSAIDKFSKFSDALQRFTSGFIDRNGVIFSIEKFNETVNSIFGTDVVSRIISPFTALVEYMRKEANPTFQGALDVITKALFNVSMPALAEMAVATWKWIKDKIGEFMGSMRVAFVNALDAAQKFLGSLGIDSPIVGTAIEGLKALYNVIQTLLTEDNIEIIKQQAETPGEARMLIAERKQETKNKIDKLQEAIDKLWETVKKFVVEKLSEIGVAIQNFANEKVVQAIDMFLPSFSSFVAQIGKFIESVKDSTKVAEAKNNIIDFIDALAVRVADIILIFDGIRALSDAIMKFYLAGILFCTLPLAPFYSLFKKGEGSLFGDITVAEVFNIIARGINALASSIYSLIDAANKFVSSSAFKAMESIRYIMSFLMGEDTGNPRYQRFGTSGDTGVSEEQRNQMRENIGENSLKSIWDGLVNDIINAWSRISELVTKLDEVKANIINKTTELKNELVTHSIIPDMVKAIIDTWNQLDQIVAKTQTIAFQIELKITSMADTIKRNMDRASSAISGVEGAIRSLKNYVDSIGGVITITVKIRQIGSIPNPRGQHGLDMIVPPGFPNDTFPVLASSGERVLILNKAQQEQFNRGKMPVLPSYNRVSNVTKTTNINLNANYTNQPFRKIMDDFNLIRLAGVV